MKKLLFSIALTLLFIAFSPSQVKADVPNPDYFTAKCNAGEIEVECRWSRSSIDSPIKNGCASYENDPSYRSLTGIGSTFGGSKRFCFKAVSVSDSISHHVATLLPLLSITLLIELPIFFVLGVRNRKALLAVLAANLISVPLLYLATILLPLTGFTTLIVMELIVIIFEAVFIKTILKEIGIRKLLMYSFIANAVSAILGSVLLNIVNGSWGL